MKDIFITSTLKSEWNVGFNPKLCQALEKSGLSCHLPQRDTVLKISSSLDDVRSKLNIRLIVIFEWLRSPLWGPPHCRS